ncbi:MarR family winged helix-turn-helix transcriptional regulator [Streptomyces sp. SR27]|uniref:MarR family winged helix-turn-helix transcriptional regulator n=1 Tax=Streptomyces sp. SR27 TaxID=3076630 RepID=UPI00295AB044|nr:MarR family winged helix-turn-helix transcriptional regulator [Streptomyces sp. SR27]MDV9189606.1 MarR family winged helix-turn-helix transcriptional regulator [Streptomyces sp. SR27]
MQSPSSDAAGGPSDLFAYAVLLRTLNRELNRSTLDFAHRSGLHATDIHALSVIMDSAAGSDEPATPTRLKEELRLTSGAVTACLDRLERSGHISRVRDSADRRVVHLVYNSEARELAREYFSPLARATETARGRFTPAELATIASFLRTLNTELAAAHEV